MHSQRFLLVGGLIVTAILARFVPHPPNFSPVGAVALFAGAHLASKRLAFAVPILALLICDFIVGFHSLIPFVYGSFALTVGLGISLRKNRSAAKTALAAFVSACVFFLVTNLGNWLLFDTFPKTPAGLLATYLAGIPYFQNTLLSELFYTFLLFGSVELLEKRFVAVREEAQAA